jgi:2,3-dihydro-2,3-dihydroxybenzoate dehydrogenase
MALALITGAAGALGPAIARALARDGWTLALADRNAGAVTKAAANLGGARAYAVDLNDSAAIDEMVADIEALQPIGALINAAHGFASAGAGLKPFLDQKPAEWRSLLDANVYPTLDMTRAVVSRMAQRRKGVIVSISTSAGFRGRPQANAYSAAMAGVQLFTHYMAQDCAKFGVRINCVIAAEMEFVMTDSSGVAQPPPLGVGDPGRDVGEAVAFLASSRASHTTGSLLDVSGGWTLY